MGKQNGRCRSSQPTPIASKLLALEPPSMFVEPQGKIPINVQSLSLHQLDHFPCIQKPPAYSMETILYSIFPRTCSFMSHLLIIAPQGVST